MYSIKIPVNEVEFLAATVWERSDAKAVVILHPATAVVQAFYQGFAEYLFNRGFSVLTYDYRGTGHSKSGMVRSYNVSMSDWIEHDVGCITAWAKARFPELSLLAVGHSVGGHAVLLSTATHALKAAVIVASHAGVTSTIKQTTEKSARLVLVACSGPGSLSYLRVHACEAPGAWRGFTGSSDASVGALERNARLFLRRSRLGCTPTSK